MRVALIVDNPKRDLNGVVLTAYQLARHGAETYVVPMYQQGYDVPLLRPDGVVVNYARANNQDLLISYRSLGICVMVMDTEGGVVSEEGLDSPVNWAREVRRSGLGQCIDRYFFWGSRLYEAFMKESGIAPSNLQVTGCPRYDFCAAPWRSLLDFPARDYVLVNTNFSAINPRFTGSSEVEKRIFRELGWPANYIERLFSDLQTAFPRYLETIEELARRQPRLNIRIRPHPFEREDVYQARFAAFQNIVIDSSGSVLPAIANASCVLHLNCGTAVESLMLGTPAVCMEYLNTPSMRAHAPLPKRISIPAASFQELEDLVCDPAALRRRQDGRRDGLLKEFIEPWFYQLDGRAAERLAAAITAALAGRKLTRRSIGASLIGSRPIAMARLLTGTTCNLFGSRLASRLQCLWVPARRAKKLRLEDVAAHLERVCTAVGRASLFSVAHARHPTSRAPLASIRIAPA